MTHKLTMLSTAVALALAGAATHAADFGDKVSIRGFGTIGAMHSSEDNADVLGSAFMPDGAGHTRDWDMRSDSRFAVQANVAFTDKLELTVQAISQYRYDRTFTPDIEWANLKYSFTPDLSVRVGRIALPTFMVSDSRLVGYANTWVRPPEEVYQAASITNSDGMDISYSFSSGSLRNTIQAFAGRNKADVPSGKTDAKRTYGANYLAEIGDAAFRVSYIQQTLDIESDLFTPLLDAFTQLAVGLDFMGYSTQAGQARAMASKYRPYDMDLSYLSLGAQYDPGAWFAWAEFIDFGGDSFISDVRSGYVMGGVRLGQFTPYAILAKIRAFTPNEPGVDTTGLPLLIAAGAEAANDGMRQMLAGARGSQESAAIGLRWDAFSNFAVKAQYNYVDLTNGSHGMLGNRQPNFVGGGDYSLFSLTVDFIF